MNKADLVVHEIDIKNGIVALFDRRERILYSISVADVKWFDMSSLPGRPRKAAAAVVADPDLENQIPLFPVETSTAPVRLVAQDFVPDPKVARHPLGGGQL